MRMAIVHWKKIEKLIWESISETFVSIINFQFLRLSVRCEVAVVEMFFVYNTRPLRHQVTSARKCK